MCVQFVSEYIWKVLQMLRVINSRSGTLLNTAKSPKALYWNSLVWSSLASYPVHVGRERQPGIDCLHMRNHSQKTWEFVSVWKLSVISIYIRLI